MSKIETLKKNYEFNNVLKRGKYCIGNQIIVYITENKLNKNIIGIAINTKLCHAVGRNRLKRLIRESYRVILPDLKTGYNIVFLWNKKVEPKEADFKIIKNDMIDIFKKTQIFK